MAEYGSKMQIIATGGLSEIFADKIEGLIAIEKNLTLEGLNFINKS